MSLRLVLIERSCPFHSTSESTDQCTVYLLMAFAVEASVPTETMRIVSEVTCSLTDVTAFEHMHLSGNGLDIASPSTILYTLHYYIIYATVNAT